MSYNRIIKEINFELNEMENLLELYREELLELEREPNLVELTALAGVLHSFYSGIEKIFLIIAKRIDKNVPYDFNWHKTLLVLMTEENQYRKPVISTETKDAISQYLTFRHFYRHSYSFHLKWSEMKNLVISIRQVWETFADELSTFVKSLEESDEQEIRNDTPG